MTKFNFSLADLATNDTSSTGTNPFWAAYMLNSPTNRALLTSASYLTTAAGGGQSYDAYTQTSMLSISDVMLGTPLANDPTQTLQTQAGLLTAGVTANFASSPSSNLGIFNALVPTDIGTASGATANQQATSTSGTGASVLSGNSSATSVTPSNGIPTTAQSPGGLPAGMVAYPNQGIPVLEFVNLALQQVGDQYVWAAAGTLTNTPGQYDCSGLVMWCLNQIGLPGFPHYTGTQYQTILNANLGCSLEQAYNTCGALLFSANSDGPAGEHVAISLGNNSGTIEAADQTLGVIKGNVREIVTGNQSFDVAGLIPGLDYSQVVYGSGISTMPNTPSQTISNAQVAAQQAKAQRLNS